jgi:hypothetical protein
MIAVRESRRLPIRLWTVYLVYQMYREMTGDDDELTIFSLSYADNNDVIVFLKSASTGAIT